VSTSETEREQDRLTMLYGRLDELRERAAARLAGVLREAGGTPQARAERDAAVARYTDRLARLAAAENGLCFGRLDLADGARYYIGRIGLLDESADGAPLLLDWRAPAARPFYVATAAAPAGVRRRRHIATRGRRVVRVDDEVLGRDASAGEEGLIGEAALLAALEAGRTGRMRDVVATLRAEQDRIIRSDHRGVLVVQGGPGTGKTAVALHRAAYLLYTHPALAARGVLVVGPNVTFLGYIGQVLPGLGETSVLLSTVGELFPGVTADRAEPPETAEIKGRAVMAAVLATAVRDRQAAVAGPVEVEFGGEVLRLDRQTCARAAARARATGLPHNQARPLFHREIIAELAGQLTALTGRLAERLEAEVADVLAESEVAEALAADLADLSGPSGGVPAADEAGPPDGLGEPGVLDTADVAELRRALREDAGVQAVLDGLWPPLTPQRLLTGLFADPVRLASAAPGLTEAERRLLVRAPGGGWSAADVPLLDEAAELLGEDDRAARAEAARERVERIAYAQGVLDIAAGSRSSDLEDGEDPELLTATDLVDAERLAERHEVRADRTVAERAATDRTWTFGHVIVDEAQELSQLAWRLLMRRCPTRSMTVVGDVAQTGDAAGTSSWERALEPHVGARWRLARLTVNYRTPAKIMAAASGVLAALGPELEPARSVRETGVAPWRLRTTRSGLPGTLAELAAKEAASLAKGRLAVIVPPERLAELGAAVAAAVPGTAYGADPDLGCRVVVLGVRQAKGLEFDSVLVADPGAILAGSARGHSDLYVALTRATQRLGVVHPGPVPAELARAVPPLSDR
jgi:DNA helicase IV